MLIDAPSRWIVFSALVAFAIAVRGNAWHAACKRVLEEVPPDT